VTSAPACESLPPKYPPIAPAPTTRMRMIQILFVSFQQFVIRGRDPRIHPSSEASFKEDGLPGQARQ
jgi:hypothetical protein